MTADPFVDYLVGMAGVLQTAGVGVYRPTGPRYTAGETGIALRDMPDDVPDSPDTMIVLSVYQPGGGDLLLTVDGLRLQVITRGTADPLSEMTLRGKVYQALAGLRDVQLGSVHLAWISGLSSIDMGRDARGRYSYSSNFDSGVDMPATALRS